MADRRLSIVVLTSLYGFYNTGRNTRYYTIVGYIRCDNGIGGDNGIVADVYTSQDGGLVTNPDIIADDDRTFGYQFPRGGRYRGFLLTQATMAIVGDQDKPSCQQTIANHNLVDGRDMTILTDVTMIANGDARGEDLVMITGPTAEDGMALDDGVIADGDLLSPASPEATRATYDRVLSQMAQERAHPKGIESIPVYVDPFRQGIRV